jgi:hypothetical protein
VDSAEAAREAISRLVRELGQARGSRRATTEEIARLRDFFGRRVLRSYIDSYIQDKYEKHVIDDLHWPEDTTPEEYLESLRETVLDQRSSIYPSDATADQTWAIYFFGRVRRAWRGPSGSDRIVVIFNAEHHRLVTGFQPTTGNAYVRHRGGFWIR